MALNFLRRQAEPQPAAPRPNYTAIAILEHDLLGIPPKPGTAAALTIALRRLGDCTTHQPVETTTLGQPGCVGMCTRCGKPMIQGEGGAWTTA